MNIQSALEEVSPSGHSSSFSDVIWFRCVLFGSCLTFGPFNFDRGRLILLLLPLLLLLLLLLPLLLLILQCITGSYSVLQCTTVYYSVKSEN